jgi:hypothetical protein
MPVPKSSRAGKRSPVKYGNYEVDSAAKLYENFSGHDPESLGKVTLPKPPKVAILIGQCDGLLYTTVRDGVTEKYIHKFKRGSKPNFCVSSDGKQILLLGGKYNFTERGIVDHN